MVYEPHTCKSQNIQEVKEKMILIKLTRFEPRSHFKSRLSLIVQVNIVLNRTVVVDSD